MEQMRIHPGIGRWSSDLLHGDLTTHKPVKCPAINFSFYFLSKTNATVISVTVYQQLFCNVHDWNEWICGAVSLHEPARIGNEGLFTASGRLVIHETRDDQIRPSFSFLSRIVHKKKFKPKQNEYKNR